MSLTSTTITVRNLLISTAKTARRLEVGHDVEQAGGGGTLPPEILFPDLCQSSVLANDSPSRRAMDAPCSVHFTEWAKNVLSGNVCRLIVYSAAPRNDPVLS